MTKGVYVGLKEFEENWNALAIRLELVLGMPSSIKSNPIAGWMVSGKQSYSRGDRTLGCAQTAYAQFAVEDLENVYKHDESLFHIFRSELLRNLPPANYFGIRQELRFASALLAKRIPFDKSETPDFTLHTCPTIGIECTSVHLSIETGLTKSNVAYKVKGAISSKSKYSYSTKLQVLVIDTSNLLFHEGVHKTHVLSQKTELYAAIGQTLEDSQFQSVLTFSYAWKPAGIGNGATLTSYYSRLDRSDIATSCKQFLDYHYPLGDIWVHGHLHQNV